MSHTPIHERLPEQPHCESASDKLRASSMRWRLATFPETNKGNPHLDLLYQALAVHQIRRIEEARFDSDWLQKRRDAIDAVHIHWPERIWRGRVKGRLDRAWKACTLYQVRRLLNLRRFLKKAREFGIRILWTVHNVEHHEGASWVDRWGYRTLGRQSDLLIVYGTSGEEAVRKHYAGVRRTLVMGHGNYANQYPDARPRSGVVSDLGLDPDKPVVCCVGILRKQKGAELACEAIRRLRGSVQLVVAGQLHRSVDEATFRNDVETTPGAVLLDRQLSDQEFSDIVGASTAVLLPYRKVTGSGVLFAAWSLGRGVIASDLPFFREMIAVDANCGTLFHAGDADDLAAAISRFLQIPGKNRQRAADQMTEKYSWDRCIEPLVAVFHEWELQRRSSLVEQRRANTP